MKGSVHSILVLLCSTTAWAGPTKARSFTLNRYVATAQKTQGADRVDRRSDGFPYPLDDVDKLEEASLAKFEAYLAKKPNNNGCTLENAAKRQEWYG